MEKREKIRRFRSNENRNASDSCESCSDRVYYPLFHKWSRTDPRSDRIQLFSRVKEPIQLKHGDADSHDYTFIHDEEHLSDRLDSSSRYQSPF